DGVDAVALESGHVLEQIATGQDTTVDLRMQRLHASVEHLGESSHLRDVDDGQTGLSQQPGRPPGRHDLDTEIHESADELDHSRLVMHADERTAHSTHELSWSRTRRPSMISRPSANSRITSG